MKLGSLFDGSGGFPFAAQQCGIEPVWASEIEPFPIAVTRKRFPNMKHLGDVSAINGAELEPVDIITFGSPCQSISQAGKREGLKHTALGDDEITRSGLFMEAIRIIKEMREKTDGEYPTFAVWENVPGAFSSAGWEDFRAVLQAFVNIKDETANVPRPSGGKWNTAGEIVGDGYSVAWRVLDACGWGVPQRRRRIFLVADFRGGSAGRILFEREGLRRNFAESREAWQGITKSLAFRTDAEKRRLCKTYGISSYASNAWKSPNPHSGVYEADTSRTLDANGGNPSCNQGGVAVCCLNPEDPQSARVYSANGVWHSLNANSGGGQSRDEVFAVCYDARGNGNGTLQAKPNGGISYNLNNVVLIPAKIILRRLTPTECARLQGMPDWWVDGIENPNPTEDDMRFWREVFETHRRVVTGASKPKTDKQIRKWLANPHSDSAEYKMWGNGVALPCVMYVMEGIAREMEETK